MPFNQKYVCMIGPLHVGSFYGNIVSPPWLNVIKDVTIGIQKKTTYSM